MQRHILPFVQKANLTTRWDGALCHISPCVWMGLPLLLLVWHGSAQANLEQSVNMCGGAVSTAAKAESNRKLLRLSSLLAKASLTSPHLQRSYRKLEQRGLRRRTGSPYAWGKAQINHPRLNPRAFSRHPGQIALIDQTVTYRISRENHFHWAEESAWYTPAPTTLELSLRLPSEPVLLVGVGMLPQPLPHKRSAVCEIWLESAGGKPRKIFSQEVKNQYPWGLRQRERESRGKRQTKSASQAKGSATSLTFFRRHRISLARWQGQQVKLRFVTRATPSTEEVVACAAKELAKGTPPTGQQSRRAMQRQQRTVKRQQRHCRLLQQRREQGHFDILWANPRIEYKHPTANPPNLLLILVDTLRARALGTYGQKLPTSPHIDALARQSLVFEQAYAAANRTRASVSSLLSSDAPEALGLPVALWSVRQPLREQYYRLRPTLLTRQLAKRGYAVDFIGNNYFLFNMYHRGLNMGFDRKVDFWRDRDTEEITRHSIRWLQEHRHQNFFLFVHYNAPHYPYPSPPSFRDKLPGLNRIRSRMHQKYLTSVRFTDENIGQLLRSLDKMGLANNTLVVLLADHGEVFEFHHNKRPPVKGRSLYNHGNTLYESELHVPLMLRLPGKLRAARSKKPVSLIDVAPTVLSLLGFPRPQSYRGKLLTKPSRLSADRPIFAEANGMRSLRVGPWKYIARFGKYARVSQPDGSIQHIEGELYNLQSDPQERTNLAQKKAMVARQMRQQIFRHIRESRSRKEQQWRATLTTKAGQTVGKRPRKRRIRGKRPKNRQIRGKRIKKRRQQRPERKQTPNPRTQP